MLCVFCQQTQDSHLVNENSCHYHQGIGPYSDVDIPGCWFFKLPHKVSSFPLDALSNTMFLH